MNRLLLLLSNTLLVLLEVIVLTFFASIFFKKNLSTVKFLISIILLAAFNVTALALLDKYFWLKAFVLTIVDAIWLKISYIDTIIQSIGIAIGFYSFISVWDCFVFNYLLLHSETHWGMACIFTLEMPYFKQCNAFTNNSVLGAIC